MLSPNSRHCACMQGLFGCGAHSDYGMLTILTTDEQPGLQILMDDHWVDVPPNKDHLIINLGDMLHRWTNARFILSSLWYIFSTLNRAAQTKRLGNFVGKNG